jgi:DNA modification methylase
MNFQLHHGDCLDVLKKLPDCSVDSVVCDPPYGLSQHSTAQVLECLTAWIAGKVYEPKGAGFMGKSWDAWVPGPEVWRECLRVLKPGGHALAFAGTRSMDLMSMAIRLAGFELRDSIGYAHDGGGAPLMAWCYASGFPKSLDVSKAIDKAAGVDHRGTPVTDAAQQWQGWGTALKPTWEPIILARKPLIGTVAENVLKHGTGAINVDGCRVGIDPIADASQLRTMQRSARASDDGWGMSAVKGDAPQVVREDGRWPANLILSDSPEVTGLFPQAKGQQGSVTGDEPSSKTNAVYGRFNGRPASTPRGDTGSAARFFKQVKPEDEDFEAARLMYCAKASRSDRNEGLQDPGPQFKHGVTLRQIENTERKGNVHPCVKPTNLMAYLCRLVTPPGGTVLDPFMGSGSTGKAAMLEGFQFIGIEREAEFFQIANARIRAAAQEIKTKTSSMQAALFSESK